MYGKPEPQDESKQSDASAERIGHAGRRKKTWPFLFRRLSWRLVPVVLLGALSLVILVTGCDDDRDSTSASGQPKVAAEAPNTITVSGKATVPSAPDEAVLTLTVENDAPDPGASLDANSLAVKKVMDRLEAEGVEDSAIETANVSLYPIRTYDPQTGKETLTGYRAQNTVTVTLKDAGTVGRVLAASVETGATNVSGPLWRLAEDSAAVIEALKNAAANARAKAEALASAEGYGVGDVLTMSESGVEQPIPPIYDYRDTAAAGGAVAVPPISAASIDVTATVTVTYLLTR